MPVALQGVSHLSVLAEQVDLQMGAQEKIGKLSFLDIMAQGRFSLKKGVVSRSFAGFLEPFQCCVCDTFRS